MTYKSTTKETPSMDEMVEYETGGGDSGTALSTGNRGCEDKLLVRKSLCIYASSCHVKRWRYPGETDWRG